MSISFTDFERSDKELFEEAPFKTQYFHHIFELVQSIPNAYLAGDIMPYWWKPDNYPTKDIDIFFTNKDAIPKMRQHLASDGWIKNSKSAYMCENYINLGFHPKFPLEVQLILGAIYDDPYHIIDGFDMRCCMMATDGSAIYRHKDAISDIDKGLINIHRISNIEKVKEHVLRYMKKGFNLTPEAFETIFKASPPSTETKPKSKKLNVNLGTEKEIKTLDVKDYVKNQNKRIIKIDP